MHPALTAPLRLTRMPMRWLAPLALATAAQSAWAADLGVLEWNRPAGLPPFAEITLTDAVPLSASEVIARVASPEAYKVAGLRYDPSLSRITIAARGTGKGQVRLRLDGLPADATALDLLLTVRDRLSVTLAEYRIDLAGGAATFDPAPAGTSLGGTASKPATPAVAVTPAASPPGTARAPEAPVASAPGSPGSMAPDTSAKPSSPPAPPSKAATNAPAAAAPAAAPSRVVEPAASDPNTQVKAAVTAWAQAWSRRDVEAYLASYVPAYVPPIGPRSHDEWVAQRRERLLARKNIAIGISDLRVMQRNGHVVATFVQDYQGDDYAIVVRKQMRFVLRDGHWLIEREHVLL